MSATSINYLYSYPFPSSVMVEDGASMLKLATSKQLEVYPYFFEGRLLQPYATAQLLSLLAKLVSTRFYMPPAMFEKEVLLRDPVITSGGGLLRFEGFSACCSAYTRVDLNPDSYKGTLVSNGTTNVDFNDSMRNALSKVRDEDRLSLAVGPDEVQLKRGFDRVVEKKVKLPVRWIKGFVEVQAYQSRMQHRFTLHKGEAAKFLRSLPVNAHYKSTFWVVAAGKGLRLSQSNKDGVKVGGLNRLALLKTLAPIADQLDIFADPLGESSEWQIRCGNLLYCLTISAEPARGFSGEGQVLSDLTNVDMNDLSRVRDSLKWQSLVRADEIATVCKLPKPSVDKVLGVLGSRGLVGYDVAEGTYYHRELPFDVELVEEIHPRLVAARKLVANGDVKILRETEVTVEAEVKGSDVSHRIRLEPDTFHCTCQWHSKNKGLRGPCKHVLAVQIVSSDGE